MMHIAGLAIVSVIQFHTIIGHICSMLLRVCHILCILDLYKMSNLVKLISCHGIQGPNESNLSALKGNGCTWLISLTLSKRYNFEVPCLLSSTLSPFREGLL